LAAAGVLAVVASVAVLRTSSGAPADADLSAKPALGDTSAEARYAWFLFLQAMAPASGPGGPLAFENWTEQCVLNPNMVGCTTTAAAKGNVRNLHGSALARKGAALKAGGLPTNECNPMATSPVGGYPPPSNVASTAKFCEEVFANAPEVAFVKQNGLLSLTGQQKYGSTQGGAITFPWEAIEVKADWVAVAAYKPGQTFACPDTTGKLYTEVINGTCYALVGIHISSKVLPDWLWATFEPNSSITNPNRCDPKLYSSCFDPWGTTSAQPYGKGQSVPQSPQLAQAMTAAGLNKAFNNYFLTGVQTAFVSNGKPIPMGNSFVEFNAGVKPGQASCITCHKYAYFDGKKPQPGAPEDFFGGPPNPKWPAVGYACDKNQTANCTPFVPNSTNQDFSWMLGLMPY
jgi:hypothetical protein